MKDYLPDWGRPRVEFVTSDPRAGWVMRPCQLRPAYPKAPPEKKGFGDWKESVLEGGATVKASA